MPVIDFVARRAVQTVLSLWAALTLVFVAVTVLPGDPVRGRGSAPVPWGALGLDLTTLGLPGLRR